MKKLILALILSLPLWGQGTGGNVVNVTVIPFQVLTGVTSGTVISQNLQNIGQSTHTMIVTAQGISGSSTSSSISGVMQASVNGSIWFAIGQQVTYTISPSVSSWNIAAKIQGYGSYPYLRTSFSYNLESAVSISIIENYVGNSIPNLVLADSFGSSQQMQTKAIATLVTGGTPTVGVTLVDASNSLVVYGYTISSDNTGTSFQMYCSPNGSVNHGYAAFVGNLGTLRTTIYQVGLRPIIACQPGDSLYYNLTGTPVASLFLVYRAESY